MLWAQDSLLLQIQLLPYRPPGLPEKGLLSDDSIFSRQLCNLACHNLVGCRGIISQQECIHQRTLNCNITPNISSILQWLFHGGRTEAAQQYEYTLRNMRTFCMTSTSPNWMLWLARGVLIVKLFKQVIRDLEPWPRDLERYRDMSLSCHSKA